MSDAHARPGPCYAQDLAHIEQSLYHLHHEIRLLAQLSSAGNRRSDAAVSLETLGAALGSYADRMQALHTHVEVLNCALLATGKRGQP